MLTLTKQQYFFCFLMNVLTNKVMRKQKAEMRSKRL